MISFTDNAVKRIFYVVKRTFARQIVKACHLLNSFNNVRYRGDFVRMSSSETP